MPPVNDLIANATFEDLSGGSVSFSGDTTGATDAEDVALPDGPYTGPSVWFTMLVPGSGAQTIQLDLTADSFSLGDQVYSELYVGPSVGVTTGSLTVMGQTGSAHGPAPSTQYFTGANGGDTVYFYVSNVSGGAGVGTFSYTASIAAPPPPNNDLFVNAQVIAGGSGSVAGDNTGYTNEPNDPLWTYGYGVRTAWFKWSPPADGWYDFWTSGPGTLTDTTLAVGEDGNGTLAGLLLGWIDDDNGSGIGTNATGSYSEVPLLYYLASKTYYIEVAGFQSGQGTFTLNWASATPPAQPANDNFVDAITITGDSLTQAGDTTGSTREFGEPNPDVIFNGVWYKWVAPRSGQVRIGIAATTPYVKWDVWQGASLSTLNVVSTNIVPGSGSFTLSLFSGPWVDDASGYYIFSVTGGETYYIRAHLTEETFTLRIEMESATPPVNDSFAAAIDLTGPLAVGPPFVASTGHIDADINGATLEFGEQNSTPLAFIPDPKMSMWWKFTLEQNGVLFIEIHDLLPGAFNGSASDTRAGRIEVWKGTSLSSLTLKKTWNARTFRSDEAISLDAGTYYIRAASENWNKHFIFRYRIAYTTIAINVGVIDSGNTSIPGRARNRKASAVLFFGNDSATDGFAISTGAVCGNGAAIADLTQFAGSWSRPYENPAVSTGPSGNATMTNAHAWQLMDTGGTIVQQFEVTSFNDDGSISLNWSVNTSAGKVGYFVIYDVEAWIQYATWDHTTDFPSLSTDWEIRYVWGFQAYNMAAGTSSGFPNDGVTIGSGSMGIRDIKDNLDHKNTVLITNGDAGTPAQVFYMDGEGETYEGFLAVTPVTGGVTWSRLFISFPDGHSPITSGVLLLGGIGWTTLGTIWDPSTQLVNTSWEAFQMAGALVNGSQTSYNDTDVDPGITDGSLNATVAIQNGAWDIDNNQFCSDLRMRSFQNHLGGPPYIDAVYVNWRGFYSDRMAFTTYAIPDVLLGNAELGWYQNVHIDDPAHGSLITTPVNGNISSECPNAQPGFATFGSLVSIPAGPPGPVSFNNISFR